MLYFCADDYGLDETSSKRILNCLHEGVINKVSVFPNLGHSDLEELVNKEGLRISLHLNLVEGRCMSNAEKIGLIADKNGNFKHDFGGLLKTSILHRKEFEKQIYEEIKAQVLFFKDMLPQGVHFCIDSNQHTYMIPTIFKALIKVLKDEKVEVKYMRIPAEPLAPFIKTPSLYLTYSAINVIKQWLLKFFWLQNKRLLKSMEVSTAEFFGILFSGKMDETRVSKILSKYIKLAEKKGRDIEVLFHPGYLQKNEVDLESKNIAFEHFYLSENRKVEYDAVMKLSERSVH